MAKCVVGCACKRHVKRSPEELAARGRKISASKMGHEVTAETRAKIGAASRGRKPTTEGLERQRAAMLARPGAHGHGGGRSGHRSPEYRCWGEMKQRCHNPRHARYASYGGRGIVVCDRWRSFANFLADMGEKPEPKSQYSIERLDNDGPYSPENCVWADRSTQQKNRPNFNSDKRSGRH